MGYSLAPDHWIIEGIDRLGKGTLIENLINQLGHHIVYHYEKPKSLPVYGGDLRSYQFDSFDNGFAILNGCANTIFDRFHLGECVYSPLYRNYSGDYVFELEQDWLSVYPDMFETCRLVLLTTSDFSFIQDDGLAFDFNKKEEEQAMFITAFEKSQIPKVMIDVSNGNGGFKDPLEILNEVILARD